MDKVRDFVQKILSSCSGSVFKYNYIVFFAKNLIFDTKYCGSSEYISVLNMGSAVVKRISERLVSRIKASFNRGERPLY